MQNWSSYYQLKSSNDPTRYRILSWLPCKVLQDQSTSTSQPSLTPLASHFKLYEPLTVVPIPCIHTSVLFLRPFLLFGMLFLLAIASYSPGSFPLFLYSLFTCAIPHWLGQLSFLCSYYMLKSCSYVLSSQLLSPSFTTLPLFSSVLGNLKVGTLPSVGIFPVSDIIKGLLNGTKVKPLPH